MINARFQLRVTNYEPQSSSDSEGFENPVGTTTVVWGDIAPWRAEEWEWGERFSDERRAVARIPVGTTIIPGSTTVEPISCRETHLAGEWEVGFVYPTRLHLRVMLRQSNRPAVRSNG